MSENGTAGYAKQLWWIMGIIASVLVLLGGAVINQQINQVTQIINRLDSLDRRISAIEVQSAEQAGSRSEIYRRLGLIEADTREIRERIRKLY